MEIASIKSNNPTKHFTQTSKTAQGFCRASERSSKGSTCRSGQSLQEPTFSLMGSPSLLSMIFLLSIISRNREFSLYNQQIQTEAVLRLRPFREVRNREVRGRREEGYEGPTAHHHHQYHHQDKGK